MISKIIDRLLLAHKFREMQYHNFVAEKYAMGDEEAEPIIKSLVADLISESHPTYVLDLGCGAGRYFSVLRGKLIVGVDLSIQMLKQSKRRFKAIDLVKVDMFHLPFRGGVFDFVISISVIGEHCPFSWEVLDEVKHTLSPNGMFAFTVVPLHHHLLMLPLYIVGLLLGKGCAIFCASRREVERKLGKLGFKIVCIKEIHSEVSHYFIVGISFPSKPPPSLWTLFASAKGNTQH